MKFLPWLIFSVSTLFFCYEYLLRVFPSLITPELMSDFSITAASLGNFISFYYYIYTPMQLLVGILMDTYSPKHLLVLACSSCILGSFFFAYTHQILGIGISRLLTGFGSAFAFVGILKLASVWFQQERFGSISGRATSLGMLAVMLGENMMSSLIKTAGWRNTLLDIGYGGILLVILMLFIIRDKPRSSFLASQSSFSPHASKRKDLWEEIIALIKNPLIWLNGCIGGLLYLPILAFAELWGIPFLQSAYPVTKETATKMITMVFLGMAVGGPLSGGISDTCRRRCLPIILGSISACLISALLILVSGFPQFILYVLLFLLGLTSSVQMLVFPIAREISPDKLAGTAIAFTNMLVMISV